MDMLPKKVHIFSIFKWNINASICNVFASQNEWNCKSQFREGETDRHDLNAPTCCRKHWKIHRPLAALNSSCNLLTPRNFLVS